MLRLLSTRTLTPEQQAYLPKGLVNLKQYDAVEVVSTFTPINFDVSALHVFTSSNAVRACFLDCELSVGTLDCCCVGSKTRDLLLGLGHRVLEVADSAAALATLIAKKHAERYIYFYSGNRSLRVIPDALREAERQFIEVEVYHTALKINPFDTDFDMVLFFSPSGVESYFNAEVTTNPIAICIGETTAMAAKKHTNKYLIAKKPTVEDVLFTTVARIESYE
jgi:uroporphyrinogen-III synthase